MGEIIGFKSPAIAGLTVPDAGMGEDAEIQYNNPPSVENVPGNEIASSSNTPVPPKSIPKRKRLLLEGNEFKLIFQLFCN